MIGAGAVVTKDVPAGHVAFGIPAWPVRKVALDVPDAPGLQYERQGLRDVVVAPNGRDSADTIVYASQWPRPGSNKAGVGTVVSTLLALKETADDVMVTVGMTEMDRAERQLGHALGSMDLDDWMMIGVEALVLVMAVFGAWFMIHILLY